jgi:hypothetical protein
MYLNLGKFRSNYGPEQGIMRGRKCRLSTEMPNYQHGWAVLAASRLLDTLNAVFILCNGNSPNLASYIKSRVYILNSQSTVPLLCSSLDQNME